ncbi:transposase, partial [Streptomyces sp. NPDC001292]|uniref:transposase n=1 Tax=Streptomyces sp. NPDC001292 TaxID=3364558 RepID=UPI0036B53274
LAQGLLTELHDRLRRQVRVKEGRDPEPSAGIIDSQSVKADAVVGADSRGFDGGKKINGRKRHLVTDCLGLLLVVLVTAASTTDRDAASALLPRLRKRYFRLKLVWADSSYSGALVEWAAAALRMVLQVVKRAENTAGFKVLPRSRSVKHSALMESVAVLFRRSRSRCGGCTSRADVSGVRGVRRVLAGRRGR